MQHALGIVAPGGIGHDYGQPLAEGSVVYLLVVDIDCREARQAFAHRHARQLLELLLIVCQQRVLGLSLAHGATQLQCLGIVGRGAGDEVAAQQIVAYHRFGVVAYELLSAFQHLWRVGGGYLLSEVVHQLVGLGAFDLHLLQMRGVAFYLDALAGLGKDGLFGEVGENHYQRGGSSAHHFVAHASALQTDGVDAVDAALGAINVKLTLVHVE